MPTVIIKWQGVSLRSDENVRDNAFGGSLAGELGATTPKNGVNAYLALRKIRRGKIVEETCIQPE